MVGRVLKNLKFTLDVVSCYELCFVNTLISTLKVIIPKDKTKQTSSPRDTKTV